MWAEVADSSSRSVLRIYIYQGEARGALAEVVNYHQVDRLLITTVMYVDPSMCGMAVHESRWLHADCPHPDSRPTPELLGRRYQIQVENGKPLSREIE